MAYPLGIVMAHCEYETEWATPVKDDRQCLLGYEMKIYLTAQYR